MVYWVVWRGTKPGTGCSRYILSAKSWTKRRKSGILTMGELWNLLASPITRIARNCRPGPCKTIPYGCLGHGEYVSSVISTGASGAGLVMLEGARTRLVFRRKGKLGVENEGIMRAKVAGIKRSLHILDSMALLSASRRMKIGGVC